MNRAAQARAAFLQACERDVAVRKPGNVSDASPGHGMQAALFRASAQAAAQALFMPGWRVGARIEAAVVATRAAAGCNTNLGILLLCAPLAVAAERWAAPQDANSLRATLETVLAELDLTDARDAFRAITLASPGGLGDAPDQDVHQAPTLDLRAAMTLAADRDLIARQYRDGYADLFGTGLLALQAAEAADPGKPRSAAAVQRLYLQLLSTLPDSHIVRKQGAAVAQTVMNSAQGWMQRWSTPEQAGWALDQDPAFAAWDTSLKASGVNPGTTADLTVATLMIDAMLRALPPP